MKRIIASQKPEAKPGSIFSTREADLAHARKLLDQALESGDADYAWDLVDFLNDSCLLDKFDK